MKKILLPALCILSIFSALACVNPFDKIPGVSTNEDYTYVHGYEIYPDELKRFIQEKEITCAKSLSKECSDLAIGYMYVGEYAKALDLTRRLVLKYPREYPVIITHAVALELNTKYKEALAQLRTATKLNPESHHGSEWIHEKILEQVIRGNTNPRRSILGLYFGDDEIPRNTQNLSEDSVYTLREMLGYQLNDRLNFVREHNPLFGSLLYDFANLLYLEGNYCEAHTHFIMAKKYGYRAPSLDGKIFYTGNCGDYLPGVEFGHHFLHRSSAFVNTKRIRDTLPLMIKACNKKTNYECLHIALLYQYLNQYDSALVWSRKVSKAYPGHIRVQRIHTYILELNEKYGDALKAVRTFSQGNPDRLDGSEWIYEKILEAYMSDSVIPFPSVLHIDFGNDSLPRNVDSIDITNTLEQLYMQMELRTDFIKKGDPVMASLIFDYANLQAVDYPNKEFALASYRYAKELGYSSDVLEKRIKKMELSVEANKADISVRQEKNKRPETDWFLIGICIIILGIGLFYAFR